MANVTVLGLGAMGSRMAKSLIKSGHSVTVWNRSREKAGDIVQLGAQVATTPREAVAKAEFAIAMVRDDDASREVWLDAETGALPNLPSGCIGIESSTITLGWAQELGRDFVGRGIEFLDAPVSGSLPQADAAQLVYFVGGSETAVAQAEPVLKTMGSAVHHAGPIGSGAAVKLMVNSLLAVQMAAWAEMLPLMEKCGVPEATALEIVGSTGVASPFAKTMGALMVARLFPSMFSIDLLLKDMAYTQAAADAAGAETPMAKAARDVFARASEEGMGSKHYTAAIELYSKSREGNAVPEEAHPAG